MQDRHISISITTATITKAILIGVAACLVFYLREIVLAVLTAVVIASAIEPAVTAMERRRIPRIPSVILLYLSFFASFGCLFYFFLPSVLSDIVGMVAQLPGYLESFSRTGAFDEFARALGMQAMPALSPDTFLVPLREMVIGASPSALSVVAHLFGGITSLLIVVVFSFYFAMMETGVDDFLRVIVPPARQEYAVGLWRRAQHKIGLWMQGQLLLALIMGVLVYLELSILQVPHALVLAIIAAVFEIIPVFGPILAAVPAVGIAFAAGGFTLGILTVALYVINQQFENHLIYPLVVTKVVGVPPLLVILALFVGAHLAGFWGILLSVPAAAIIQELVRDLQRSRAAARS